MINPNNRKFNPTTKSYPTTENSIKKIQSKKESNPTAESNPTKQFPIKKASKTSFRVGNNSPRFHRKRRPPPLLHHDESRWSVSLLFFGGSLGNQRKAKKN